MEALAWWPNRVTSKSANTTPNERTKVASQAGRLINNNTKICLTGGLCECSYIQRALSERLGVEVCSAPDGRYAGAIGAALSAYSIKK